MAEITIRVEVKVPKRIMEEEDWMGNGVADQLEEVIPDEVYYTDENGKEYEFAVIVLSTEETTP